MFNRLMLTPLFDTDDSTGKVEELGKEEMINLLDDEKDDEKLDLEDKSKKKEEKEEVKEEEKGEEKEEKEEEDDLKEIEEELEEDEKKEVDEDELELIAPARRKDILKEFPTLFKKFPFLERAMYREQQFTEILPTIKDAKEAVSKAQTLDNFEADLLKGNPENILKAVKETDSNSFNKIVDDYLPALARVDEKAYYHVMGSVIKSTIVQMVQEAKKSDNDTLRAAAAVLNQFAFGSSEFEPTTKLAKEDDKSKTENENIKRKEQEFTRKQYERARDDLSTRTDNVLKSTITANIDPKESMTEYVRKTATRDAMEELQSLLEKDTRLKVILDKLWENAFRSDFSQQSVDRIKSAYLSRAKTLLPTVIKKARNEALKGMGKRVREDEEEKEPTPSSKKGPLPAGRSTSSSSAKSDRDKAKQIPEGMRSVDFLMQD